MIRLDQPMSADRFAFWRSLAEWMAGLLTPGRPRPLMVGLCAPQGAGKTTLTREVCRLLGERGIRAATVSIDDFYLTRARQVALAAAHPANRYFQQRGLPGTHEVALGTRTLRALKGLGTGGRLAVPAYERSAHSGRGDRLPQADWPIVEGPLDLVILEGWMLGFTPLPEEAIADPHFRLVNERLGAYGDWLALLDAFIWLDPVDFHFAQTWRAEAEEKMIAEGRPGMTPAEVAAFVAPYLAAYAAYYPGLRERPPVAGPCLHIVIGPDRLPLAQP